MLTTSLVILSTFALAESFYEHGVSPVSKLLLGMLQFLAMVVTCSPVLVAIPIVPVYFGAKFPQEQVLQVQKSFQ